MKKLDWFLFYGEYEDELYLKVSSIKKSKKKKKIQRFDKPYYEGDKTFNIYSISTESNSAIDGIKKDDYLLIYSKCNDVSLYLGLCDNCFLFNDEIDLFRFVEKLYKAFYLCDIRRFERICFLKDVSMVLSVKKNNADCSVKCKNFNSIDDVKPDDLEFEKAVFNFKLIGRPNITNKIVSNSFTEIQKKLNSEVSLCYLYKYEKQWYILCFFNKLLL